MSTRLNRAVLPGFLIFLVAYLLLLSGCTSDLLDLIADDVETARTAHLWRGIQKVASGTTSSEFVGTVSVVGQNVYICYRKDYSSTTRLYVARSTDDCETFTGTADGDYIDDSSSSVFYKEPHVIASTDGAHVYLSAFADSDTTIPPLIDDSILFWRSQDGGDTWSAPATLASASGINNDYYQPYIMIRRVGGEDYVYVTTYIERDTQINYRRSTTSGASWDATIYSSSTGNHASRSISVVLDPSATIRNAFYYNLYGYEPKIYSGATVVYDINGSADPPTEFTAIASDESGNLYIVFCINSTAGDGGLSICKSTDDGATWGARKGIDPDGRIDCSIAVEGPNVYIGYYDYTEESLMLAKSTNSGGAFTIYPVDSDSDATTTMGKASSIAVDGNSVYISYLKTEGTSGFLMLAVSRDGGETW